MTARADDMKLKRKEFEKLFLGLNVRVLLQIWLTEQLVHTSMMEAFGEDIKK